MMLCSFDMKSCMQSYAMLDILQNTFFKDVEASWLRPNERVANGTMPNVLAPCCLPNVAADKH
jgi:hypothetical protein